MARQQAMLTGSISGARFAWSQIGLEQSVLDLGVSSVWHNCWHTIELGGQTMLENTLFDKASAKLNQNALRGRARSGKLLCL